MLEKVTAASWMVTALLLCWADGRAALDTPGAALDGLSIVLFVSTTISLFLLFAWGMGLDRPDEEE